MSFSSTSRASGWAAGALLINAFVWGVSWWPFRQLEQHGLHPLWATALMYSLAVICVLAYRPAAWRSLVHTPQLWWLVLASGLTNVGFNWAVTVGDVVRVVLLFYLMPAWSVLLAWPLLGEKPTRASIARLVLALVGVLIVLKTPGSAWPLPQTLADYLALMGGFCFALTNVMLRRLKDTPSEARMFGMFGGGSLMALLTAMFAGALGLAPSVPAPHTDWVLLALVLSFAFLGSNLALQYGAARLKASTTSLVMLSEVLFASVSSIALGAAQWEARVAIGGGLIVLAALWAALQD
jgi:drug/metabolite transporter (DMT)-like permease